jgi:hypothetical protein
VFGVAIVVLVALVGTVAYIKLRPTPRQFAAPVSIDGMKLVTGTSLTSSGLSKLVTGYDQALAKEGFKPGNYFTAVYESSSIAVGSQFKPHTLVLWAVRPTDLPKVNASLQAAPAGATQENLTYRGDHFLCDFLSSSSTESCVALQGSVEFGIVLQPVSSIQAAEPYAYEVAQALPTS